MLKHKLIITARCMGKTTWLLNQVTDGDLIVCFNSHMLQTMKEQSDTGMFITASVLPQMTIIGNSDIKRILVDEYFCMKLSDRKLLHKYSAKYDIPILAVGTANKLYDPELLSVFMYTNSSCPGDILAQYLKKSIGNMGEREYLDYKYNLLTMVNCDVATSLHFNLEEMRNEMSELRFKTEILGMFINAN